MDSMKAWGVVVAPTLTDLTEEVNKQIAEGYQPLPTPIVYNNGIFVKEIALEGVYEAPVEEETPAEDTAVEETPDLPLEETAEATDEAKEK